MNSSCLGFPNSVPANTVPLSVTFIGYDNFSDLSDGVNNAPNGGFSWASAGATTVPELWGYDDLTFYLDGPLNSLSKGFNWAFAGTTTVPN